jgi:4-hydroxy 2-oxovalerate aldolase
MKILDCTLRDGGYYNSWDFSPEVVEAYLHAVAESGIEYVELGLRNFKKSGYFGAFAYTTESFLKTIELPAGPTYGVMVDAKTILTSGLSVNEAVDRLFVPKKDSQIGLVRVAAHFSEVYGCKEITQKLKSMGYIVGFNLMQSGGKPSELISELASEITSWDAVDALYFADSLGNMNGDEVVRIITALRKEWQGDLGIHTHDNMSLGLTNSITSIQNGVEWIDSTITGMGRGAGNTQTERLISELKFKGIADYECNPIYELVIRYFEPMQKQYGWGSNLLYFIGAQNNVHPTYIQKLLSDSHYGVDEVVGAIDFLKEFDDTASFDESLYSKALSINSIDEKVSGSSDLIGLAEGKEILVVANGPSLETYETGIKNYIEEHKPYVLAVNALPLLNEYVDSYVISHNSKFLSQKQLYSSFNTSVILPIHRFSEEDLSFVQSNNRLLDYGVVVKDGVFESNDENCVVPYDLTACYALAAALAMKPKSISLVGFDGYEKFDPRQAEVNELFKLMHATYSSTQVRSLTPSSYAIAKGSIYEPTV